MVKKRELTAEKWLHLMDKDFARGHKVRSN